MIEVLAGNTVRFTNTFYNFEQKPTDPNIIKIKVYDHTYKLIEEVNLGLNNRISDGKFFYDYHTPPEPDRAYIIEFYGEISGNPTFERELIKTTFLKRK